MLRIINPITYALCITMNGLSATIMPTSLDTISNDTAIALQPAGWAFSIWGIIYCLLGVFVVYSILPDTWVPSRSNELIFNQIGWWFPVNMILNGIWLPTFQSFTTVGFVFA